MEEGINEIQPLMEDNFNRRQHQWKTTLMEDDFNGRQPQWKMTSTEDDLSD